MIFHVNNANKGIIWRVNISCSQVVIMLILKFCFNNVNMFAGSYNCNNVVHS